MENNGTADVIENVLNQLESVLEEEGLCNAGSPLLLEALVFNPDLEFILQRSDELIQLVPHLARLFKERLIQSHCPKETVDAKVQRFIGALLRKDGLDDLVL